MSGEVAATTVQKLSEIWNDILQRTGEIDSSARFFELGGDSVSMMMMLFRLEQDFGVEIEPECVFGDDSLRGIAMHVEAKRVEVAVE